MENNKSKWESSGYGLCNEHTDWRWKLYAISGGEWGKLKSAMDNYDKTYIIAESPEQAIQIFWDKYCEDESDEVRERFMAEIGDQQQIYSLEVITWNPRIPTEWAKILLEAGVLAP